MEEASPECYKPNCSWILIKNLTRLEDVYDIPPLRPNPELSGIGVILGFSITAYLMLFLLLLHYFSVYNYRRWSKSGKLYINAVDESILNFTRQHILPWSPSRRFEYAMEKAVLILSDLQLVTGLGLLISGYIQLDCGISAYHWQMLVYIAWFSSFSFLSAMAFLEGYFQTNNPMRLIRISFMLVFGSILVVALLPTGSDNWLNLLPSEGGFYPGLSAECYFKQMGRRSENPRGGPKEWSMIVSILVVALSYVHAGIRLFDPTAEFTRRWFRQWPGSYVKRFLHFLQIKASSGGVRAALWAPLFFIFFTAFIIMRAVFDAAESMLGEILWLTFAMAWGTIKLYDTRASAIYNSDGTKDPHNLEELDEDHWSFGQTLPLILLLLPLLSMAQAYLDNDAKAQDTIRRATLSELYENGNHDRQISTQAARWSSGLFLDGANAGPTSSTSAPDTSSSYKRCDRQSSIPLRDISPSNRRAPSPEGSRSGVVPAPSDSDRLRDRPASRFDSLSSETLSHPHTNFPRIPQHPYPPFTPQPWYTDHIILLILQVLQVTSFALFLLTELSPFLGVSIFLRNRLFLEWILAIIPSASLIHLAFWYIAGWIVNFLGCEDWLKGKRREEKGGKLRWLGPVVYWVLRLGLVSGLVVYTFMVAIEVAGPQPLMFGLETGGQQH